jgi:hypothetical protein
MAATWKKLAFSDELYQWKGQWLTATAYVLNDCVGNDGSGYVCTAAHSSIAADEPGVGADWATHWDVFVQGGTTDPMALVWAIVFGG